MTAPERIWAGPDGRYWADEDDGNGVDVEYVLASRVDPALEAAEALAEAVEEQSRAKDKWCECFPYGDIYAAERALDQADLDLDAALARYREATG